ncbi:MFS transporter [Demequina globuliformis]|uniref:MFS transporter n=1 Tax=Demequina globuliformis TaxID=676202 RepID=UPI0007854161|nr:MFS transporter [Demequina globuliformis]
MPRTRELDMQAYLGEERATDSSFEEESFTDEPYPDSQPYLAADATRTMEIVERIEAEEHLAAEDGLASADDDASEGTAPAAGAAGPAWAPTVSADTEDPGDSAESAVESTRELPAIHDADPLSDEHTAHHDPLEAEPTTLSLPVVGGSAAVVLDEPEPGYRSEASLLVSAKRAKLGLFALATAAFATGVNEASVVALSADIAAGLGIPVATIGILATAFALTVVLTAIPLTLVTKRWSRRVSLTIAMAVWSVGLVIAASSTSLGQLAAGRVTSGLAHALFWAIVAPTAASLFAPHLRPKTVTGIMLGSAAAGVLGTPLVTLAGSHLGWQAPYIALAALGIILAVALAFVLPSSATTSGTSHTVGDLPSRSAFFRVLTVAFLVAMGMSTTWTYIVPFFTEVSGLSADMLPLLFALGGLLAVAATMLVGKFLIRHAVRTVAVGAAMVAGAWCMLALGQAWSAIAFQAMQAAGWAVLVAALLNWAMRHTPWRTEMGGGMYTTTANAGAAAGPLVGAGVVSVWDTTVLPYVSLAMYVVALAVTVTVSKRTRKKLNVPRSVRAAQTSMVQMQARRSAWARRQRDLARERRAAGRPRRRAAPNAKSERMANRSERPEFTSATPMR